jgi:protocatechuate 3,4-dioxygenase beta subunit
MSLTRRVVATFLAFAGASALLLAAAPQDLSSFMGSAPPCLPDAKPTPAVPADNTFKAGSPLRPVLAGPGMPGTRLTLSGTVSGTKCGRIAGAEVDLWQAGVTGAYDMVGFGLRGHQLTAKDGSYQFLTIVPGAAAGRAKHLNLRVRVKGHPDFFTEIYFPNDPANTRDRRFKQELLLQPKKATAGEMAAVFDVLLEM